MSESIQKENRARFIAYLHSGERPEPLETHLGVEVEHFVVGDSGEPLVYEPHGADPGMSQILERLESFYPDASYGANHDLIGLLGDEGSVTLEPAAQLEFSAAPYTSIAGVEGAFQHFYEHLAPILEEGHAHLETWGFNPKRRALELELIPKKRYFYMNDYFAWLGTHGERMMRTSASTQVSIDYSNEGDAVRKLRIAQALVPVLAAIADNMPIFEGRENHVPLRRLQLWREVDNLRCGPIPRLFDDGYDFAAYADWMLSTPPIFVTRPAADDPDGERLRPFYDVPASEAYADAPLAKDDVEHIISMFWPDVRLKRFVEIRPADCMPLEDVLGYTALVKGLFYSEESLRAIEDALRVEKSPDGNALCDRWRIGEADLNNAIASVQFFGFKGTLYRKSLLDWETLLFDLADAALPEDERHYLEPLRAFAASKTWWHVDEPQTRA